MQSSTEQNTQAQPRQYSHAKARVTALLADHKYTHHQRHGQIDQDAEGDVMSPLFILLNGQTHNFGMRIRLIINDPDSANSSTSG